MPHMIGIDFGNATSCAAVWNGRHPEIIELPDGEKSLPSAVAVVDGETYVGREALERGRSVLLEARPDAQNFLFQYFKQRLGEKYDEETDSGHQTTLDPETGLVAWRAPEDKLFETIDLAACVIATLLDAARDKLGERPTEAVITVPADAGDAQKAATIEAGRRAGLTKVVLMHEPTAAALAYGFGFDKPQRIVVVDHGAGTVDMSYIQAGKGRQGHTLVEVKATDGRKNGLGGMVFDQLVANYLAARWRTTHPENELSKVQYARVLDQAEVAKIRLSGKSETQVRIANLAKGSNGVSISMEEPLNDRTFNEIVVDLRVGLASLCRRFIEKIKEKDPKFTVGDINEVVLVGGMTRCPAVREAIKSVFKKEPRKDINPEEAVALGAAVEAARLSGRKTGLTVRDIISHAICVETLKDVPAPIFEAGTNYPAERTVTIKNAHDGQAALSVAILEGTAPDASRCERLASFDHIIAEPGPAQTAAIKLLCRLDDNGRFSAQTDGWQYEGAR